jgi:hypothetical protein
MGALICSIETDFEMPVAFIRTMSKVVAGEPRKRPFRFVLLSGVFVEQDEGRWLWFLEHARKTKVSHVFKHGWEITPGEWLR